MWMTETSSRPTSFEMRLTTWPIVVSPSAVRLNRSAFRYIMPAGRDRYSCVTKGAIPIPTHLSWLFWPSCRCGTCPACRDAWRARCRRLSRSRPGRRGMPSSGYRLPGCSRPHSRPPDRPGTAAGWLWEEYGLRVINQQAVGSWAWRRQLTGNRSPRWRGPGLDRPGASRTRSSRPSAGWGSSSFALLLDLLLPRRAQLAAQVIWKQRHWDINQVHSTRGHVVLYIFLLTD